MKIGALIRSYGITKFLKPCIQQYIWCDKVMVMNYRFCGVTPREDKTQEICTQFDKDKVQYIVGEELKMHEVLDLGLQQFKDFDFVFIADNDEFIERSDQNRIIDWMILNNDVCGGQAWMTDYARDFEHKYEQRPHTPPVICRPNKIKFYETRCFNGVSKRLPEDIRMHHLGYMFTPEDMVWKYAWEKPVDPLALEVANSYEFPASLPQEIRNLIKECSE
jgi:hypothetical protein